MKVLITGASGLLGRALLQTAPKDHHVAATHLPNDRIAKSDSMISTQPADITNAQAVQRLFDWAQPDIVIHAAAASSIDWCEENEEAARAVNTIASQNLAAHARQSNAHFVFVSSNAVYGGAKADNSETDNPNPCNHYGRTKVAVEEWLARSDIPHTIVRPNLMYGWPPGWAPPSGEPRHGGSLASQGGPPSPQQDNQVTRTLTALRANDQIAVVADSWFSPLLVNAAAEALWQTVNRRPPGIINFGGSERVTLFELSKIVADVFNLDETLITPKSVNDTAAPAARAIDTSFDTTKMQEVLGQKPISPREGLTWMKQHEPAAVSA